MVQMKRCFPNPMGASNRLFFRRRLPSSACGPPHDGQLLHELRRCSRDCSDRDAEPAADESDVAEELLSFSGKERELESD
ncbi:hypothetical protein AVEN_164460-1 [Araneus ventricosus]|uniref:Uncharacterized protein n=1 Tax=Araneus ventricosus TaxID=182803 RepID=A0A4Y2Q6Z5_ARAVE|nr:hypothetical protein AVEN_164460-1 [Araneus ventricosus]